MKISLVIPVKDEEESLNSLYLSIKQQTLQPDEIIVVDGGSTDRTVAIAKEIAEQDSRFRLIQTPQATPGKGRNIGTENARYEWIAYTDAGIVLENDWLERLVSEAFKDKKISIIYGNVSPVTNNWFKKIAALAYVPAQPQTGIRSKYIVSYLMRREVWGKVGGFPDWRAAEDLAFMEKAEKLGFKISFAPDALVYWELSPDTVTTFRKFTLYSKHNAWAGRQWDWHHGILKQYLITIPFVLLTVFHSWWWLSVVILWLFVRTLKRIMPHHFEFGWSTLFNPLTIIGTAFLILVIDAATFVGWGQASLEKKK